MSHIRCQGLFEDMTDWNVAVFEEVVLVQDVALLVVLLQVAAGGPGVVSAVQGSCCVPGHHCRGLLGQQSSCMYLCVSGGVYECGGEKTMCVC